jgi:hypothetical protein
LQQQDDQEDHGADRGVDDGGDKACANMNVELRQQPSGDDCADNANDDIAEGSAARILWLGTLRTTRDWR